MAEIKIDFNNCDVAIEKIFDIHDNLNVTIQNNVPKSKTKPSKPKKEKIPYNSDKPKTLKYYRHGNKGVLMTQQKRVDIVFKKWTEWNWIDDNTHFEDFDSLFEGEPRYCNIQWTANTTILTILLQKLIEQPYIEKQTGLSARSLVINQFGKTPNSDRNRLDNDAEEKINITLYILDTKNPLPERNNSDMFEEPDIQDDAFKMVLDGQLHLKKSI